jgi:hypothetical protein
MDFTAFEVRRFVPHLYAGNEFLQFGCGATALSLLMGCSPFQFNYRKDWTPAFMVRTLRKHGFRVQKLEAPQFMPDRKPTYRIGDFHVILCRVWMLKEEASWYVIHNGLAYHNFQTAAMDRYEFINHPLKEMYMVVCDAWKQEHPKWGAVGNVRDNEKLARKLRLEKIREETKELLTKWKRYGFKARQRRNIEPRKRIQHHVE